MIEGLTYNTATSKLVIPAYGRHVQRMLEQATDLESERQQALVERIVRMMAQLHSNTEQLSSDDLERKLWKHAYRMSEYKLTAVPPDGKVPTPEEDAIPPEEVPYPKSIMRQRNYGEYVQKLIARALETEDPERRQNIVITIGSYMKLAYSMYNDAKNISDKTIRADLEKMSDGKLTLAEDANLDAFMGKGTQSHIKQTAPTTRRRKRNKGGGGGRNRRRYRKR